jgi:hypothetical protein
MYDVSLKGCDTMTFADNIILFPALLDDPTFADAALPRVPYNWPQFVDP